MGQRDIRKQDVRRAIAECKRLGEREFLKVHGYKQSKSYLLLDGGRFYNSKAIVGVAHGYATGKTWSHNDHSGGAATVVPLLEKLGYKIVKQPFDECPVWEQIGQTGERLEQHLSRWTLWKEKDTLDTDLAFPGVYTIAILDKKQSKVIPLPSGVVYIGETSRTLSTRLWEFEKSAAHGLSGHSGGHTYHTKFGADLDKTYVSVLPIRLPFEQQDAVISLAERLLIWMYTDRWGEGPACNSK